MDSIVLIREHRSIPAILKVFDLTVATTGINEKTAKRLQLNYEKSFTHSENHARYYPNAMDMSLKTIYEKSTGKILGVQIVGYGGVDKRCDIFATAIRAQMTAYDLTRLELCYMHHRLVQRKML